MIRRIDPQVLFPLLVGGKLNGSIGNDSCHGGAVSSP